MRDGVEGEEIVDAKPPRGSISGIRSPQLWLALGITLLSVWFAVRGIPIESVADAVREANFMLLLLVSAPFYVASLYFRALRWRHLAAPVVDLPRIRFFRSTALGFMGNNLLPFRIGEVIRSWTLARDADASLASVVGTVVLERVIDLVVVLAMSLTALAFLGRSGAVSELLQQGSVLLLPLAAMPIVALVAMRVAPDRVIQIASVCTRRFPERVRVSVESGLRSFIQGLGALRGGSHLLWILLHSIQIWLVTSTIPILVGFWIFGVEFGTPFESLLHAWILLGAVGVAVAMPAAPGFIGPYQLAFTVVLVPFGVPKATALAMGILVWFVFWLTVTLQGLYFMRLSGLSVAELTRRPE